MQAETDRNRVTWTGKILTSAILVVARSAPDLTALSIACCLIRVKVSGRLLPCNISMVSTPPETLAIAAPTALATSWNFGNLINDLHEKSNTFTFQ